MPANIDPLSSSESEEDYEEIQSTSKLGKKRAYTSVARYETSFLVSNSNSSSSTPKSKLKKTSTSEDSSGAISLSFGNFEATNTSQSSISSSANTVRENEDSDHDSSNNSQKAANADTDSELGERGNTDEENRMDMPNNRDIMNMMLKLLEQNKEIKKQNTEIKLQNLEMRERLDVVEKSWKKKKNEKVHVPLEIKHHVKIGYQDACKQPRKYGEWDLKSGLHAFSDENKATSNFVFNFVKGLHPDLSNRDVIVNAAIKTHFESKRTMAKKKEKDVGSGKRQAKIQRKVNKCNRRKQGIDRLDGEKFSIERKEQLKMAMTTEMMSSEDEKFDDDGRVFFERKPLSFTTKKFEKLKKLSDESYLRTCSQQSKDQFKKRTEGSPSKRAKPKSLEFGYDIFIKK